MGNDHEVRVGNGQFTFICPANHPTVRVVDRLEQEPWVYYADKSLAIFAMMRELDAARFVVQAARDAVDAPTLQRKEFLQSALAVHDRLVSDREPPSVWCGDRVPPSGLDAHGTVGENVRHVLQDPLSDEQWRVMPTTFDRYRLGIRVRFDAGWPVPARAHWLDGIVTEIHDRLVFENFAAVRVERELVVRKVLSDGSIMSSMTWHFGEQDSAALAPSGSSPSPI